MSAAWTHTINGGPWPERVGLRCRIVDDPGDGIYPFDKRSRTEVVILVEDDPFDGAESRFGPALTDAKRGWTCILSRVSLEEIR